MIPKTVRKWPRTIHYMTPRPSVRYHRRRGFCGIQHQHGFAGFTSSLTSSFFALNLDNRRLFSSPSHRHDETILYQRPATRNDLILKSGIATATFHSAYWIWYITDFIPLVNGSDMPELHIDPLLGWTGLIFALAIQSMVLVYPKRLVSTLSLVGKNDNNSRGGSSSPTTTTSQLYVYTYSLLVRPSTAPTKYKVGELTMDPLSAEVQQIVTEYRGNAQLFRGRLGLKANNTTIPYLLDIQQDSNVVEPELLMQALLSEKDLSKQQKRSNLDDKQPVRALNGRIRRGGKRRKR